MSVKVSEWRLKLVSILSILILCAITARLFQVQVLRHRYYQKRADLQWKHKKIWPAKRGAIYDRNGVPLAVTYMTYTVGVTPKDFPRNNKEKLNTLSKITGIKPIALRKKLARDCPYIPLARDLNLTESDVNALSSMSGIRLDPNHDRLYLSNAVPRQLVGSVDYKDSGVSGIEKSFDRYLKGDDGWFFEYRGGGRKRYRLLNAPYQRPKDGSNLVLTIDERVQKIVDYELDQGVKRYGARYGVAIVVDPSTGYIIALSERAGEKGEMEKLDSSYSVSCIYEPGSTFKLITDSFLLEKGKVAPDDSFYAENGKASFDFGVFHDDHEYGWLSFKESFVLSSNICTIKASMYSDPYEFYNYILKFGFGAKSGVMLPAESRGMLAHPKSWSRRTLPSISIGHEIGVTPIQMAMAYCTLANGGRLVVPQLALRVEDGAGGIVKRFKPIKVRRVFSKRTAALMKDFCRDVVLKGTGKKAAVKGLEVAGKTGTSQKSDGRRYMPDKYVASFAGFVPVNKPKMVCLVMLDEPRFPYIYGGESSAVIFSRIVEGINMTTDILDVYPEGSIALDYGKDRTAEVPSFMRLSKSEAFAMGEAIGLTVQCEGENGFVYSQKPDPGTVVSKGSTVTLRLHTEKKGEGMLVAVPDVRNMSLRKARRLIIGAGLKCRFEGFGSVKIQRPRPGRKVARGSEVALKCRPAVKIADNGGSGGMIN